MLFSSKKERTINIHNMNLKIIMPSKRSLTKSTYPLTPFVRHSRKCKLFSEDRKHTSSCKGGQRGRGDGFTLTILHIVMVSSVWTRVTVFHAVRFQYVPLALCPWILKKAVFRKRERKKRGGAWGTRPTLHLLGSALKTGAPCTTWCSRCGPLASASRSFHPPCRGLPRFSLSFEGILTPRWTTPSSLPRDLVCVLNHWCFLSCLAPIC